MNHDQHWYVLGAGAMGTLLRWQFDQTGIPATLLHHREGELRRRLQANGRRYEIIAQDLEHGAGAPIQRLIIATKAGQVAAALALVSPHLAANAVVLTTANGLGFERELPAGEFSLLRAVTTAAAYRDANGDVSVISTGQTQVGDPASSAPPPNWFDQQLARLPGWAWSPDIMRALGEKFSINCVINALTAVQRCRNGELLIVDQAGNALAGLCAETEPVLRDLGLWNTGSLQERAVQVCRNTAANRSSMLQDVLAGRMTEIDYLNGELIRRAPEAPLPLNHALVQTLAQIAAG